MKLPLVLTAALTCASAHAQLDADRSLILANESLPAHVFPLDGLRVHQNFVGENFLTRVDELDDLGTHTIDRVRWDETQGGYHGVLRRDRSNATAATESHGN